MRCHSWTSTAPPPGQTRVEFLEEVQYLSRLPDRIHLLDDDLSELLTAAFARHPWVERVDVITIEPPRKVRVRLTMRRPVLAVRTNDGLIAVDAQGWRLPTFAGVASLPVFEGEAMPPRGPAGTKWGDPRVEKRAAELK